MSFPSIAEREWLAVSPERVEHRLVLRIGSPQHKLRGEWTCSISLGVLDTRVYEIAGMDSWQAIALSMQHLAIRIKNFEDLGWRFYWDCEREQASPNDLYPGGF